MLCYMNLKAIMTRLLIYLVLVFQLIVLFTLKIIN